MGKLDVPYQPCAWVHVCVLFDRKMSFQLRMILVKVLD